MLFTTTIVVTVLAYFAVSGVIANRLTRSTRTPHTIYPTDVGMDFEDIRIPSRDGTPIAGWYIPNRQKERVVLMVHGLWVSRAGEFGGRWLEYASRLYQHGYALLLIDLRAHGESDGDNFTLGVRERLDVLGAVEWLNQQGYRHIGVHGVSLGAASAISAAADPDGGEMIGAIVADGAFADLRDILNRHFRRVTGMPQWLLPGGIMMTRLIHGTNLDAVKPVKEVGDVPAPLLFIHSDGDRLVPRDHFNTFLAERPDAEEWLVPASKHARIYNDHPDEYVAKVTAFFDQHLG